MKLSQLIKGLDIINLSADATGDVSALCYAADKCEDRFPVCGHRRLKT